MITVENTIATISFKHSKVQTITVPAGVCPQDIDVDSLTKSYAIAVINLSSQCLTIAGTRRIGGSDAEWKWTPIPKTCRNCTTSYQQCFNEKRWSIVMTTDCNSQPFELFIGYFISDTEVRGSVTDIRPSCNVGGGVIGVSD